MLVSLRAAAKLIPHGHPLRPQRLLILLSVAVCLRLRVLYRNVLVTDRRTEEQTADVNSA